MRLTYEERDAVVSRRESLEIPHRLACVRTVSSSSMTNFRFGLGRWQMRAMTIVYE